MTTMQSPGFGQFPGDQVPGGYVEQRTSIMAILSLVFALTCIPAIFAVIFAIGALISIGRSNGRLTGRGLAIAGLVIGLIFSGVQVGAVIGVRGIWGIYKAVIVEPDKTMTAIEGGDWKTARLALSPEAAKRVTDADFEAFRTGYHAELGQYRSIPGTLSGVMDVYAKVGAQWQQFSSRGDVIPMFSNFDNGAGLILFQFDPATGSSTRNSFKLPPSANMMIVAPSGTKWTLYDPLKVSGAPKPGDAKPVDPKANDSQPGDSKPSGTTPQGQSGTPGPG